MGRETAFTATGSSLCSRIPPLLVSFNALVLSIAGQEGRAARFRSKSSDPQWLSSSVGVAARPLQPVNITAVI